MSKSLDIGKSNNILLGNYMLNIPQETKHGTDREYGYASGKTVPQVTP